MNDSVNDSVDGPVNGPNGSVDLTQQAASVLRQALADAELDYETSGDTTYVVTLPGERKLRTTVSLVIGAHTLSVNAFVARCPDENAEGVYRWLLQRNLRARGVSFAVDPLGDIYLAGNLPLRAVSIEAIDQLLGSVLELSDGSFNPILELGFASAIRREWDWRIKRGEPTANLAAFAHLIERTEPAPPPGL